MSLKQAVSLHGQGNLKGAERGYRQILARNPGSHKALHGLGLIMHQRGRDGLATALIRKAIEFSPSNSRYHYHLGEVLRTAGHYDAAICAYRQAIHRVDTSADYFFGLGNALAEQGSAVDAIEAYRLAVFQAPDDEEIRNHLGNALADTGQFHAAAEHFRKAIALAPTSADAHHNLALTLKRSGKIDEALEHARQACEFAPERVQPLISLGQLLELSGSTARSVACYIEAGKRASEHPELLAMIGDCLRNAGELHAAVDLYRTVVSLAPTSAAHRAGLCQCLIALRQFARAEAEARVALDLAPDCPPALVALAICLQTRGEFAEAGTLLRRAIGLDPGHTVAAYLLATNGGETIPDEELANWQARVDDRELSAERRFHLHFAIARAHEHRREHDAAFRHFQHANGIKAHLYPFNARRHAEYVQRIMTVFTPEFFAQRPDHGVADARPVFVVGMPRSGSTLVEQILAGHPHIATLGEHPEMRQIVRELPGMPGIGEPVPECCHALSPNESEELAWRYQASMPEATGRARRIVDKMLGNFLRLGVIALLFPRARIVHCVRDPLDTCVSCFTQDFDQGLRFTTDLTHLASFYAEYRRLITHWQRVLPLPIMDVHYESLVSDPETVSRELLAFCDLPWDENCLSAQRTRREIATASVWQARQPVYTSSVGRWRRYETHLRPLIDGLRQAGVIDAA